jgi:nucleoside-diphosphate-sugar epimerase
MSLKIGIMPLEKIKDCSDHLKICRFFYIFSDLAYGTGGLKQLAKSRKSRVRTFVIQRVKHLIPIDVVIFHFRMRYFVHASDLLHVTFFAIQNESSYVSFDSIQGVFQIGSVHAISVKKHKDVPFSAQSQNFFF